MRRKHSTYIRNVLQTLRGLGDMALQGCDWGGGESLKNSKSQLGSEKLGDRVENLADVSHVWL